MLKMLIRKQQKRWLLKFEIIGNNQINFINTALLHREREWFIGDLQQLLNFRCYTINYKQIDNTAPQCTTYTAPQHTTYTAPRCIICTSPQCTTRTAKQCTTRTPPQCTTCNAAHALHHSATPRMHHTASCFATLRHTASFSTKLRYTAPQLL